MSIVRRSRLHCRTAGCTNTNNNLNGMMGDLDDEEMALLETEYIRRSKETRFGAGIRVQRSMRTNLLGQKMEVKNCSKTMLVEDRSSELRVPKTDIKSSEPSSASPA